MTYSAVIIPCAGGVPMKTRTGATSRKKVTVEVYGRRLFLHLQLVDIVI